MEAVGLEDLIGKVVIVIRGDPPNEKTVKCKVLGIDYKNNQLVVETMRGQKRRLFTIGEWSEIKESEE